MFLEKGVLRKQAKSLRRSSSLVTPGGLEPPTLPKNELVNRYFSRVSLKSKVNSLLTLKLKNSCFQGTHLCACFWTQTLCHRNKRKLNKNSEKFFKYEV